MRNRVHLIILACAACLLLTACGAERNLKKGEKYLSLGEYYDAATQFRKAYQGTAPKDRELRGQRAAKMAYCYNKINESQRAIAAYRNVIRYHQDDVETHLGLAENLMKAGNYKEAEKEFQLVIDSLTSGSAVTVSEQPAEIAEAPTKKLTAKEKKAKNRKEKAEKKKKQKAEKTKKSKSR